MSFVFCLQAEKKKTKPKESQQKIHTHAINECKVMRSASHIWESIRLLSLA